MAEKKVETKTASKAAPKTETKAASKKASAKKEEKTVSAIDQLLDPNNTENIVLYDAAGKGIEFEQIAIVPLNDDVYSILKPIDEFEGVNEDEALVFVISEGDNNEFFLDIETDEAIIDSVFEVYYKMFEEQEKKDKKGKK